MRMPRPVCRKPWENCLVEVNGDCYFCCFIIRPGGKIGNLRKEGFEKIWTGRRADRIRRSIVRGKIPYRCQLCPYFGEFKPERSRLYRIYFLAQKTKDAVRDCLQGGFTRSRVDRALKRIFRQPA